MPRDLITVDAAGLRLAGQRVWIDPQQAVPTALLTHAHGDHARPGSGHYFTSQASVPLVRLRLDEGAVIDGVAAGEELSFGDLRVSFHSAGHILGSSMIRISDGDQVWVVSGDYSLRPDPSCSPCQLPPCDVFITESTFALPVYRWPPAEQVLAEIYHWWQEAAAAGRACVLFAYALGKTQRLLAGLRQLCEHPVFLHGAAVGLTEAYRAAGIEMLATAPVAAFPDRQDWSGELILAPPSAAGSTWMHRFGKNPATGFASGWMAARGVRRRRGYERGFVLSDHVDWPDLLRAVRDTGARRVLATHGWAGTLARYLQSEVGLDAAPLDVLYEGPDE